MPEVQIRKELYDRLESNGVNATERVNAILNHYLASFNKPAINFTADEMHLSQYHEHGNAD